MGTKFGAILLAVAVHLLTAGASAAIYHLTDLGTLGGDYSEAHAINSSGQVVGFSTTSENHNHAFVYSAGSMSDLGGGIRSQADGINDAGQIAGFAMEANQPSYAFRYSAGAMTNLGTLGGLFSNALGVNASGQVVGLAYTADNTPHAFLSSGPPARWWTWGHWSPALSPTAKRLRSTTADRSSAIPVARPAAASLSSTRPVT